MTKDNLLAHIVKLWYRTEGCPEKYAFNAGPSLKSGFAKAGLFPYSPEVIRKTVKAHHDPENASGFRVELPEQDFEPLWQVLRTKYNITNENDLEDYKQYTLLKQKGITPGAALANSIQKYFFEQAPTKPRRVKNKQLSTEAGALITSESFIALTESLDAAKKTKKAGVLAKRKKSSPDQTSTGLEETTNDRRS